MSEAVKVPIRDWNSDMLCQSRDPENFNSGISDPGLVKNVSKRDCPMEDFAILNLI